MIQNVDADDTENSRLLHLFVFIRLIIIFIRFVLFNLFLFSYQIIYWQDLLDDSELWFPAAGLKSWITAASSSFRWPEDGKLLSSLNFGGNI